MVNTRVSTLMQLGLVVATLISGQIQSSVLLAKKCNRAFSTRLLSGQRTVVTGKAQRLLAEVQLLQAVSLGDVYTVSALIDSGTDVNVIDKDGHTPLIQACYAHSLEVMKMLIEAGADMQAQTSYNFDTPLIAVAQRQQEDMVVMLASRGAHTQRILSPQWRKHRYNAAFIAQMVPYIELARKIAKSRTQLIRLLFECTWDVPKDISRLILSYSGTEWYHSNNLDRS